MLTDTQLTIEEIRPVAEVISRLAQVQPVKVNPGSTGSPYFCFRDDEAFGVLGSALFRFRGNVTWLLVSRVPLVCLTAVPEEVALRARPVIAQEDIRALIVADIVHLAEFIAVELNLRDKPSQGISPIEYSPSDHVESGPGGPAFLVSDPSRYISNRLLPTSQHDRTVDYWMSTEELDELYGTLHTEPTLEATQNMDLLRRISESTYENLVISPEETASLKEECLRLSRARPHLKNALSRVSAICDLASNSRLGIVVLGG